MIPSEYRLDEVAARLIERLEAARRTWSGDAEGAPAGFTRIASEHLSSVAGEFRELGFADDPERHVNFLRKEMMEVFLPRYTRIALDMTEREDAGYGLGVLAQPLARVALVAVAILLAFLSLRAVGRFMFLEIPFIFAMPLIPDLVAWMFRRRHRARLVALVQDMGKIQEQATHYVVSHPLDVEEHPLAGESRPERTHRETP